MFTELKTIGVFMNGEKFVSQDHGGCPSCETISAWIDGRLPAHAPEAKHIEHCSDCRRIANTYRQVDAKVNLYLHRPSPKLSPEATARSIRLKLQRPTPASFFNRYLIHIAASVTVAAVALVTAVRFTRTEPVAAPVPSAVQVAVAIPSPGSSSAPVVSVEESQPRSQLNEYRTHGANPAAIHIPDLNLVSFGQSDIRPSVNAALDGSAEEEISVISIEDSVRHVWVVKDSDIADEFLRQARRMMTLSNVGVNPAEKRISFTAKGYAKQLVQLMHQFVTDGGELLSPAPPQPEQSYFTNDPDDPVTYHAEIFFGQGKE